MEWSTTSQMLLAYRISVPYAYKYLEFLFEKKRRNPWNSGLFIMSTQWASSLNTLYLFVMHAPQSVHYKYNAPQVLIALNNSYNKDC